MSDHIIRKWRRDCWQEMSAGGMRVGMPHISVLCTDALRMCLEIDHLSSELAEREAEIERLRGELGALVEAALADEVDWFAALDRAIEALREGEKE